MIVLMAVGITVNVSCVEQEDFMDISNAVSYEQLYNELSNAPSVLIGKSSRSGSDDVGFPTFDEETLNYMASLTVEEMVAQRDSLINSFGKDLLDSIEESEYQNYVRIFDIVGGHDGVDALSSFAIRYLESKGGWTNLNRLMPSNLSDEQGEIYVAIAVFVDRFSRPVYTVMTAHGYLEVQSRSSKICDMDAAAKLVLAGFDIGVDGMVDAMTGGAGLAMAPLEGMALGVELYSIWVDYEICNGRWH